MSNPIITDENLVPSYELPAVLRLQNGARVETPALWHAARRPELIRLFEAHVYGATPRKRLETSWELVESGDFGAGATRNATRKQIAMRFRGADREVRLDLLLFLPKTAAPCPLFLSLNFCGNHTVHPDPAILLPQSWLPDDAAPGVSEGHVVEGHATEAGRGKMAGRWPVEMLLARGYGVATAYYGDLDPDFDDGFQNGVHPLFYAPDQTRPAPDEWGSIGAWAWGLSRMLDYLESDAKVDARRVAVVGHSRLGKAALWAGAQDERFAMVISNDSGCGGAALSRRCFGETVSAINTKFPHWFCANFHAFGGREGDLSVDQHQLLALVAPRPLYVASAQQDLWADPRGEWLGALHAAPIWELLGFEGHGAREMPPIEAPLMTRVGYHIRAGKHDINDYDWARFVDFADLHLGLNSSTARFKTAAP